jgi:hypothetical protein
LTARPRSVASSATVAIVAGLLALVPACGGSDEGGSPQGGPPAAQPQPQPEPSPQSDNGAGESDGQGGGGEGSSGGGGGSGGSGRDYDPRRPDTPSNDVPPPPGSPAERFERECEDNPEACY